MSLFFFSCLPRDALKNPYPSVAGCGVQSNKEDLLNQEMPMTNHKGHARDGGKGKGRKPSKETIPSKRKKKGSGTVDTGQARNS